MVYSTIQGALVSGIHNIDNNLTVIFNLVDQGYSELHVRKLTLGPDKFAALPQGWNLWGHRLWKVWYWLWGQRVSWSTLFLIASEMHGR